MTNVDKRSTTFVEKLANIGMPLFVIAGLAHWLGAPVGSLATIAAAVIAAVSTTVFRHFGERHLKQMAVTEEEDGRFYTALLVVNAVLTLAAVVVVQLTIGF